MSNALDGYELIRGDSYSATVTLSNLANLPGGHPLKTSGFQTTGYSPRFTAKKALTDDDSSALIIKTSTTGISIVSATVATIDFHPSDTANLRVPLTGLTAYYDFQFAANNGGYVYTLERGTFTVTLDSSITTP